MALADNGQVHLRNLVSLRQIGIEIVFARKHTRAGKLSINAKAELDGIAYGALIKHGQYAGHAKIDQAGLRVGLGTKRSARARKYF